MTAVTEPSSILDAEPPAQRPRLVILDLDGTCLDAQDQSLHPRIRDAVRATVRGGTPVIIASGRMYRSALPHARELQVVEPLVCYQGALVRAMPVQGEAFVDGVPLGRLIFEDPLAPDVALRGLEVARRGGWHRQAYRDDQLICEEDRPEGQEYSRIAQVPITYVDDLAPVVARGTTKLVCVVEDAVEVERCEAEMRTVLGDSARVTRSLPPFVEVTDPVASKGRALMRLAERMGVSLADAVAVGDAPNDSDMLEAAGYAVAVAGAPASLLAHADAVCAPPKSAGVAEVLERLGLTG